MNRKEARGNLQRMREYIEETRGMRLDERRKLTIALTTSYHDLLHRLAIVESDTRTGIVRKALDAYADTLGEEVIYPFEA